MPLLALLASLMAASVAAQAEFAAPGFKYIGCIEAEPPVFTYSIDLPAPFSAQQCQHACHAKGKYAALDGSCHCHDKTEPSYKIIDEAVCSLPCVAGNRTAGVCGGPQCSVTGKKRYSLYQKEHEHHGHDDGDDGKGGWAKTKDGAVKITTTKTITSCPPDITHCPLTAHTKAVCPPEGCHITTVHIEPPPPITKHHAVSSAEPIPPCPEKCGPPCPPQGCAFCPPGGCLPPCPPGCPFSPPPQSPPSPPPPPACPGEHCKISVSTSAACPPGGCIKFVTDPFPPHPYPTRDSGPAKVPVTISEGARYESGIFIAVSMVAMIIGWL